MLEIGWAVGLKHLENGIRPLPGILTAAAMVASLALLALAMRTIPLGTAYAIWTGIGVAGTVAFGMLVHGEPADGLRLASLALILAGVARVKLAAS